MWCYFSNETLGTSSQQNFASWRSQGATESPVHFVVISLIDRGQNNTCMFLSVETSKAMPVNRMLDFSLLKVPILRMKGLVNKTKAIQGCMYFLEVLLDVQYLKNEIGI